MQIEFRLIYAAPHWIQKFRFLKVVQPEWLPRPDRPSPTAMLPPEKVQTTKMMSRKFPSESCV